MVLSSFIFFFFQAEDGIRDLTVTGVQTCALPICLGLFEIETLTKPPQRGHEVIRPIQNHVSRIVAQRNPDLRFRRREAEILRHNPEHLAVDALDRKSTRLNSSHSQISYAVFCLKKK